MKKLCDHHYDAELPKLILEFILKTKLTLGIKWYVKEGFVTTDFNLMEFLNWTGHLEENIILICLVYHLDNKTLFSNLLYEC